MVDVTGDYTREIVLDNPHRGSDYPQADEFFKLKKRCHPQELFQNEFYRKYEE
jgi:hypothetical protein